MKKILFILVTLMTCMSVNAQTLIPSQSNEYEYDVVFDSIQVPDYFGQQGLKPSYYMNIAADARIASLTCAVVGTAGYLIGIKSMPNDHTMATSIAVIGGIASVTSYIVSLVYDKKAAKVMSNIKLTGNGMTISF